MLTPRRLQTHSPIKQLFYRLENSIHTYINHHKTHAMATRFGGVGDTSMENPDTQDMDNNSEDAFQDEKYCSDITLQDRMFKTSHRG